jgi:hypothetical protein
MNVQNSSQRNRQANTLSAEQAGVDSDRSFSSPSRLGEGRGGASDCTDAWKISGLRGDLAAFCCAGRVSHQMFTARDGPLMDCHGFVPQHRNDGKPNSRLYCERRESI